jgi:hypothetical protein
VVRRYQAIGEASGLLIDEWWRKTASFLFLKRTSAKGVEVYSPCGTVVFLSLPLYESSEMTRVTYAVTARHVLDMTRARGPLYLGLNRLGLQKIDYIPTDRDRDWFKSAKTDIAVARVALGERVMRGLQYDFRGVKSCELATEENLDKANLRLGEGDDLFMVGLHLPYHGRERIQPLIRFGSIALMPYEPVTVRVRKQATKDVRGYLAEMQAWPGWSGSPVYVYFPPGRHTAIESDVALTGRMPPPMLMGIAQGYHLVTQEVYTYTTNPPRSEERQDLRARINSGIAVVLPIDDVMEVVMSDAMKKDRDRLRREDIAARTRDSATVPAVADDDDDEALTRDEFFADLTKVTRRQEPESDQERS